MTNVARHPEFPIDEWEKAPQYWGPGTQELQEYGRVTVLDFERLKMLAEMQMHHGAFKPDNGTDVQKAPVKVGLLPGSFVSVESLDEDDFLLHRISAVEIFVVINGILEVERDRHPGIPQTLTASPRGVLRKGDVVALRPGEVRLTAHSLEKRASSLALSILGLSNRQTEFVIAQGRYALHREFDPDYKPNLPYDPEEEQYA